MLNFRFRFWSRITVEGTRVRLSADMAANAIWALTLVAGFLANAGYCVYLLNKNHTWNLFSSSHASMSYWFGGVSWE